VLVGRRWATCGGRSALALAATLTTGCFATAEIPRDFIDRELTGSLDGKAWRYKYAYVDPTIATPNEDDFVFVFLPYKPKTPCPRDGAAGGQDARSVMVAAPKSTRLVKLKAPRTLVFQYGDGDGKSAGTTRVAKVGKLQLTRVDKGAVRGKVFAQGEDGDWVSGRFSAVLCDFRELKGDD
jgi:hypothetical protein